MAGFTFRYRASGGAPTIESVLSGLTGTLTKGDMCSLSSGEIVLGATSATAFLGEVLQTGAVTDGVTRVSVITDPDAVYAVTDANARLKGATLDIAGATGAQAVASSSNKEFVVVVDCTATEETLVRFNVGKHFGLVAL